MSAEGSLMKIQVSGLTIYPLKSGAGVRCTDIQIGKRGLQFDRHWMVVQSNGTMLSQRAFPQMCLIHANPFVAGSFLTLNAPGIKTPCHVPLSSRGGKHGVVSIHDARTVGEDEGDEAADWLAEFLRIECRLVRMPESEHRFTSTVFAPSPAVFGFADGYPALIISRGSLDELNAKLPSPVPMNRFRPNIEIADCPPGAENIWKRIRIGGVEFEMVKPCVRCVVPSIDQATGVKTQDPILQTLMTYSTWTQPRPKKTLPFFGQNAIHRGIGRISVGDQVEVLEVAEEAFVH